MATPFFGLLACRADDEPLQGSTDAGGASQGSDDSTGCCDFGSTRADTASTTAAPGESSTSDGTSMSDGSTSAESSTSGPDGTTGSGETSTGGAACEPTPSDIEGPFYRPGIPIGGDLDVHGDPGKPLRLEGQVFDETCQPVASAVVEIWHATPVTPRGEPGDVDATYDNSAEYRYYGQVATDERGSFSFSTLRPGWYLNGGEYRPAHVHLKVWIGEIERLTTQLYFVDDPFNDNDPWFNPVMALDPDENGDVTLDLVV